MEPNLHTNNQNIETIDTPFGSLEIPVPSIETISKVSPVEQFRIDLYRYFRAKKSNDPDRDIKITEIITQPIKITEDGNGFLPSNEVDYPIVAMEVTAFNALCDDTLDITALDIKSLEKDDNPRSHRLIAMSLLLKDCCADALKHAYLGAKMGDIQSLVGLGVIYAEGRGVSVDKEKAKKFFLSAALYGDHHALCNIGLLLMKEENTNHELARNLFQRAAFQGNTLAAHNLGVSLLESDNKDDITLGLTWLKSTTEIGYEPSVIVLLKYYKYIGDIESYKNLLEYGTANDFSSCKVEQIYFNVNKQDESPYQWEKSKSQSI